MYEYEYREMLCSKKGCLLLVSRQLRSSLRLVYLIKFWSAVNSEGFRAEETVRLAILNIGIKAHLDKHRKI